MAGHTSFKKIRERKLGPAEDAQRAQIGRAYRDILRLAELRSERDVTQIELANELEVSQANISRLERENDLYLSTLAGYINGLGGTLRIEAVFPEETYPLMELAAEPAGRKTAGSTS